MDGAKHIDDMQKRLLEMIFRETPETLTELLTNLDAWLRANRPDYHAKLQPGVSTADLDQFERRFALKIPISFRMLYQWRNGQAPDHFASLEHNRMFMPLEQVASTKEMLDHMIGTEFDSPDWWRKEWVPYLANGGGDYLCIDLASVEGEIPPRVITFWHDWEDRSVEHPSLQVWLIRLVKSMREGTYEVV